MPLDYTNPSVLKFIKETIEKADERRNLWFQRNQEKLVHNAYSKELKRITTEEVRKKTVELCLPGLIKQHQLSHENRFKIIPHEGPVHQRLINAKDSNEDPSFKTDTKMKPVEPKVTGIIYEDKKDGGRLQYLKVRNLQSPEDKYYWPQTTSNEYGWMQNESGKVYKHPQYPHVHAMKRNLESRSGPHPDPEHNIKIINYAKCYIN